MGNVYMEASQINYRGGEKKMSVEEALKNTSGEAAAIAQLQQDVSDLNDVKANKITIAPAFSAEASYDPGDLVYYNGLTYRCVNAHSGEWDADDFSATTIDNELAELRSGLINDKNIIVTGHIPAEGGYAIWNTTGIDFTNRYPVAFYVYNGGEPFLVSQGVTGFSVGMNNVSHAPIIFLGSDADAGWKDQDCFAVCAKVD